MTHERNRGGRPPEPQRHEELLEAVAQYVLRHGLSDLSLRPLAKALGTTPRGLLYHFDSKERLLDEALGRIRLWEQQEASRWLATDEELDLGAVLRRAWEWLSSEGARPFLRLFFEVYGLALQQPRQHAAFLDRVVADWVPVAQELLRREGVHEAELETRATMLIATQRGLLLDLLATGEVRRVAAAHERWVEELLAAARGIPA